MAVKMKTTLILFRVK